jgi:hypothetical protein
VTRVATRSPQFNLHVLFEIIAGCGLLFSTLVYQSLFLTWLVFAVLMVWAVRVRDLSLRWSLMSCLGGCSAICFGLMCLALAVPYSEPMNAQMILAYQEYRAFYDTMAFTGPLISGCGLGFALVGAVLTLRCLTTLSVIREGS